MQNAERAVMNQINANEIESTGAEVLAGARFIDMHTHLFDPSFGSLGLWGIDDLLTYHYLEAELFRSSPIRPDDYWKLSKSQRADLVWQTLFLENSPISEAARGVVAVLQAFGLDPTAESLASFREFFRDQDYATHVRRVFE